jgi:Holliday junction resolvasome RuvABC endonuclease subunit
MSLTLGLFGETKQQSENPFDDSRTDRRDHRKTGLLALDLATITGWCDSFGSGVWGFAHSPAKEKEQRIGKAVKNKRVAKFHVQLLEYIDSHKPNVIVYEKPIIFRAKKRRPNFASFEMIGVLKLICLQRKILLFEYQLSHIKKFATGAGNANKEDMMKAFKAKYGRDPIDDNEADAVHLYHLAIQDLKL